MQPSKGLGAFIKSAPYTKAIKRKLWHKLGLTLAAGLIGVIVMPLIDKATSGGDRPGPITFIGTGLVISWVTFYLFIVDLKAEFSTSKKILSFALIYNLLIIAVKFSLAPASFYQANPTIVVDQGGFSLGNLADFNGNIVAIALMMAGVFLLYIFVFNFLKWLAVRGIDKRFNIKSVKLRKRIRFVPILIMVAAAIFTGGAVIFIPLIFSSIFFSNSFFYLSNIFTTGYSVLIALSIMAAVGCAGAMFMETERQSVTQRNVTLLITVIWTGIGLLVVFHILWAVYFFVLTTLWPFKVVTVTSK